VVIDPVRVREHLPSRGDMLPLTFATMRANDGPPQLSVWRIQ